MNASLAFVGMATVDLSYLLSTQLEVETQVEPLAHRVVVGGLMGRAAIAAARLGARPKLLATCGTGPLASVLKDGLKAEGVLCTWIGSDRPSQHSVVLSCRDEATRSIVWLPQPFVDDSIREVLEGFLSNVSVAVLDATDRTLAEATVEVCENLHITTVLDTGSGRPWTWDLLGRVDHVIASEKYIKKLTDLTGEQAAARLWEDGCKKVFAITMGDRGGVWALGPEITGRWQAAPVSALDTAGAGDVFHGVYGWALAGGETALAAIELAAWAAGLSTTQFGNDALPNEAEVRIACARSPLVEDSQR